MKTYNERTQDILKKVSIMKRNRRRAVTAVASIFCCLVLVIGLMFLPKNQPYPEGYDRLITELSELSKDNYFLMDDILMNGVDTEMAVPEAVAPGASPDGMTGNKGESSSSGTYEEVTDNQVQGVTEADLIKRSSSHIYYLRGDTLSIYSIEGEASRELGSYKIVADEDSNYRIYTGDMEMYLSQDCTTVTILTDCYSYDHEERYIYILNLDVSNPENITRKGHAFLSGQYHSSRIVNGDLYLISAFYVDDDPDYTDKSSFLPGYGTPEEITYLPMESIYIPEVPVSAMYTVVSKLDGDSLAVLDSTALLSYSGSVYVSQENIYLTRSYSDRITEGNTTTHKRITEITQLNYSGEKLENMGSFTVEGSVKDQYSMDEYDGMLRIVTTIDKTVMVEEKDEWTTSVNLRRSTTNANLYCISLSDHKIRSCVESFAPDGESVQSVRFDGTQAYVCTSLVLSDPVFFFDLSDPDHITYKDTGTIDGYSMSLVDFAEGFLMGIGYGDSFSTLKIEIYREGDSTVISHCTYEQTDCWFSSDYKSYLIDRENRLIGLTVSSYSCEAEYVLLHFDGYELIELARVPIDGSPTTNRGVYIDGYLYLFGDSFKVEKI